jgi:hypothetical protein
MTVQGKKKGFDGRLSPEFIFLYKVNKANDHFLEDIFSILTATVIGHNVLGQAAETIPVERSYRFIYLAASPEVGDQFGVRRVLDQLHALFGYL